MRKRQLKETTDSVRKEEGVRAHLVQVSGGEAVPAGRAGGRVEVGSERRAGGEAVVSGGALAVVGRTGQLLGHKSNRGGGVHSWAPSAARHL